MQIIQATELWQKEIQPPKVDIYIIYIIGAVLALVVKHADFGPASEVCPVRIPLGVILRR